MRGDGSFSIGSEVWPGISKLIEECGELQQVCGKLIATHGEDAHWDGSNLRHRLIEEMADVKAAILFLTEQLSSPEKMYLHRRTQEKTALFQFWHREEKSK